MHPPKDPFFDTRLLSRRAGLSIQEKEYVLESVLAQHSKREKSRILRPFFALSLRGRLVGAVLAALLLIPLGFVFLKGDPPQDEFHVKGQGLEPPFFSVTCFSPSEKTLCRRGTKLAFLLNLQFRLRLEEENLYFAAFLRRDVDGLVYWYSPATETGESVLLKDLGEDGLLPKGMMLDGTVEPGRYQVFGILSNFPLQRRKIKSLFDGESVGKPGKVRIAKVEITVEH